MNAPTLQNFVGGTWCGSRAGHTFEVDLESEPGREPEPLVVARAAEADVADALDVLRAEAPPLELAVLARGAQALARASDPHAWLARRLDLEPREVAELHADLDLHLDAALHRHAARAPHEIGIAVVRRDATELVRPLAADVLGRLACGWRVLVVSDAHAPMVALRVVEALVEAGVGGRSLALVHDDGDVALRRALAASGTDVRALSFSGSSARLRALERWLHEPDLKSARAALERELALLANQSRIVLPGADVEAEARAVVHAAFARVPALAGQAPTVPGRVLCHERVFSRFTEALLAALGASADVARPLRALDPSLCEHVTHALELGLDEGATAIFTTGDRALAVSGAPGTAGTADGDCAPRLAPLVFTNVEEHMRLAWLGRPAPILCLMRVPSAERARELATELDRDPLAEDLSGVAPSVAPSVASGAAPAVAPATER